MKFRERKLKLKKATFGRGPHFLFMKRHREDMERAMFFGVPIKYQNVFKGLSNLTAEARSSVDEIIGADAYESSSSK